MNIDSTNMNPELMMNIAKTIKEYKDDYDGFVVAHGTDTMSYTASVVISAAMITFSLASFFPTSYISRSTPS